MRKYQAFDRTRLFGPEWTVTQQWTSLDVPWSADYNDTKFSIKLTKKSPVVIVLSQVSTSAKRATIYQLMARSLTNDTSLAWRASTTFGSILDLRKMESTTT